jgi:hypothetical protein
MGCKAPRLHNVAELLFSPKGIEEGFADNLGRQNNQSLKLNGYGAKLRRGMTIVVAG